MERMPWSVYQNGGLKRAMLDCFVVYLAGHNRPRHEILGGNDLKLDQIYDDPICWDDRGGPAIPRGIAGNAKARLDGEVDG